VVLCQTQEGIAATLPFDKDAEDGPRAHHYEHHRPDREPNAGQSHGPILRADVLASLISGSPFALFCRAEGRASSLDYS
jgi:hypothetical protein